MKKFNAGNINIRELYLILIIEQYFVAPFPLTPRTGMASSTAVLMYFGELRQLVHVVLKYRGPK